MIPYKFYLPQELVVSPRGKQEITLLELVTHTSGLPRNPPNLQRTVNKDAAIAINPFGKYDAQQLAEGLAEIKLTAGPQPSFAYSNFGMGLLGEALAHKAGMPFEELVHTRIFKPLGMKHTSASATPAERETMATGHTSQGQQLPPWTFLTLHGCGAICSTPNDMLTLHAAWCGLTETKLRAAMQATQVKRLPAFGNTSIGLGWFIHEIADRTVYWHNGGTTGFKMCNSFCADPAVAVVVMCNTGSDANDDGRDFYRMGDSLMRELIQAAEKREE